MTRLIWSGPARQDLFAIAEHYERIDPALADRLLDLIRTGPLKLLDFPNMGSPVGHGVRKWRVDATPFILLYAVRGHDIEIRRVMHTAMDWERGL